MRCLCCASSIFCMHMKDSSSSVTHDTEQHIKLLLRQANKNPYVPLLLNFVLLIVVSSCLNTRHTNKDAKMSHQEQQRKRIFVPRVLVFFDLLHSCTAGCHFVAHTTLSKGANVIQEEVQVLQTSLTCVLASTETTRSNFCSKLCCHNACSSSSCRRFRLTSAALCFLHHANVTSQARKAKSKP